MWDRPDKEGRRSYDCSACRDTTKIARRCRYPLKGGTPSGYGVGPVKCPAYGIDRLDNAIALQLFPLFEAGHIGLEDVDGVLLDSLEIIRTSRVTALDLQRDGEAQQLQVQEMLEEINAD